MPLLEREGLLEELASRLRAAANGRGSLVLLGAEAGAGKTAVVTEFARLQDGRAHVLIGGCDPLTTPRPLSPLIDIALDPRSRLSGSFAASAAPYELFTAIQRRMADADFPLALVIEDVHWADVAQTTERLQLAARRAHRHRTASTARRRCPGSASDRRAERSAGRSGAAAPRSSAPGNGSPMLHCGATAAAPRVQRLPRRPLHRHARPPPP